MASKTITRPVPYRISAVIAVSILLLLLSGCSKKYTFNFKTERDATNGEGTWYQNGEFDFTDLGAYIEGSALVSPFRFGGDFTVDIDFFVNVGETNYLQWLEFYLIDSDDWGYDAWIGLGMHMLSSTHGSYWVGQRENFSDTLSVPMPGFVSDGHNKLTIAKTGDIVNLTLGTHSYEPITIDPGNLFDYYNFIIVGYDDSNTIGKGVYIEKVVVTYESGNRVAVTP